MIASKISAETLYKAILGGCQHLIAHRQLLNRINIFPVADGDTGDNMASTAQAILHFSKPVVSISETLQSVADASVMGARGNSGVIFSAFFNGLAEKLSHFKEPNLDLDIFQGGLEAAAAAVRRSIPNPVEGTLLTVIEQWAKLWGLNKHWQSFAAVMKHLVPGLKSCVDATPLQLAALKKANTVDSGALGFYFFVEGFSASLNGEILEELEDESIDFQAAELFHDHTQEFPAFRYCTEAVVTGRKIDSEKLTQRLKPHGDSAVVTGNARMCRFHIHTNQPEQVFESLSEHYIVKYPKVDDMLRQFQIRHNMHAPIALVTDSSADLPEGLIDTFHIHQIQLNIHMDEHQWLDGYSLRGKPFQSFVNKSSHYPKTSCPSPVLIQEKLKQLSGHYEHVLVLTIAGALSGTYDAITQAASTLSNVRVIDTKRNSGAHGLLLLAAGRKISEGCSFDSLCRYVESLIAQTDIYVIVNDFEASVRSGRIPKIAGHVATKLKVKPIFTADESGKGVYFNSALSMRSAFEKLVSKLESNWKKSGRRLLEYCIVHVDNAVEAHQLAELATLRFGAPPVYITPAALSIGLHVGKGCVSLSAHLD